mgnify:CR=1 FL=1
MHVIITLPFAGKSTVATAHATIPDIAINVLRFNLQSVQREKFVWATETSYTKRILWLSMICSSGWLKNFEHIEIQSYMVSYMTPGI